MKEIKSPDLSIKNMLVLFNNASKFGEQYLYELSQKILAAKSIILDKNSILGLRKMLTVASKCPELLLHAAYILKKMDLNIQNISSLGNIISIPVNEILIQLSFESVGNFSTNNSGEIEYLKSAIFISTKYNQIKNAIMEATFSLFCQFVCNLNNDNENIIIDYKFFSNEFISDILSSLFQLEINLLWHSIDNQKLVAHMLKSEHFCKLLYLIQIIPNSLVQMLILEWMWRAKNCLSSSFDFKTPLQKYESFFFQINETNFRSSLHSFIRKINLMKGNKIEKHKIIHFYFKKLIFNEIDLNFKGYIDLNKDTIAIWFIDKGERKVPDVIIFKFTQVYNIDIVEDRISFLSKEKLVSFEFFSTSKPMKFEFYCNEMIDKKQALLFSQRCLSKKVSQKKKIIINSKSKINESLLKKRIYANNTIISDIDQDFNDDVMVQNNIMDDINSKSISDEKIKDEYDDCQSFETEGKKYRIKIMTFEEIERSLDELQISCQNMLNEIEKKVISELNEITSFTESTMTDLHNLSQKHQDIVEETQLTEVLLEEEASNLDIEAENLFNKFEENNRSYFDDFFDEISHDKNKFINETDKIFTTNALTALSNNLLSMKSRSIKKFNDE